MSTAKATSAIVNSYANTQNIMEIWMCGVDRSQYD